MAPGGLAKTIALMFRGLADGVPAAAAFLHQLAASEGQEVRAACARARVVHMLTRAAGAGSASSARARGAVLSALEAFCAADDANVRKMGWAGGVEVLLGLLAGGGAPEHHLPALRLLGRAAEALPEAAPAACTAAGVAALAEFVGSPAVPLEAQALAARVLSRVAAVPVRKEDATQALTNLALPRTFEVLHEAAAAAEAASTGGEAEPGQQPQQQQQEEAQLRALVGACAACTAHLVAACADCCHALLHHSALLRPTLDALLASRQFGLAQKLLEATAAYARQRQGPDVLLGGAGGGGGSASGVAAVVATA